MKTAKIIALDIESCSVSSKYPKHTDFILGISAHSTSSLDTDSQFWQKQFIVDELTFEAEEEVIAGFIEFLEKNAGAILTAYNLIGFDQPILLTRSKEHYPLGFRLLDIIPKFSLFDTMIAFRIYINSLKSQKFIKALSELKRQGHDCFNLKNKNMLSGKDSLSLWAREIAGFSECFSNYIAEDSYNHMRIAQILLKSNIKEGLWLAAHFPNEFKFMLQE